MELQRGILRIIDVRKQNILLTRKRLIVLPRDSYTEVFGLLAIDRVTRVLVTPPSPQPNYLTSQVFISVSATYYFTSMMLKSSSEEGCMYLCFDVDASDYDQQFLNTVWNLKGE